MLGCASPASTCASRTNRRRKDASENAANTITFRATLQSNLRSSATTTLRVGSGGVMLPHYSPLKVAEIFSVLSALFPGRIDLGIGRAAGTDPTTTYALQRNRQAAAPDDFPQQLAELMAYLRDEMPDDHPFRRLTALPGMPEARLRAEAAQTRCEAPLSH